MIIALNGSIITGSAEVHPCQWALPYMVQLLPLSEYFNYCHWLCIGSSLSVVMALKYSNFYNLLCRGSSLLWFFSLPTNTNQHLDFVHLNPWLQNPNYPFSHQYFLVLETLNAIWICSHDQSDISEKNWVLTSYWFDSFFICTSIQYRLMSISKSLCMRLNNDPIWSHSNCLRYQY